MGGLFNTDPPGTLPEHISTTGMLHGFAFALGVPGVLFAVTLLSCALWSASGWRAQRKIVFGSAVLVWGTMLVFGIAMGQAVASHASGPQFAVGWQNRALVIAWALWVAALAAHARKLNDRRRRVTA
jgi:predicted Kef-type K+ transport protein